MPGEKSKILKENLLGGQEEEDNLEEEELAND
jgi:hypothetical protein